MCVSVFCLVAGQIGRDGPRGIEGPVGIQVLAYTRKSMSIHVNMYTDIYMYYMYVYVFISLYVHIHTERYRRSYWYP